MEYTSVIMELVSLLEQSPALFIGTIFVVGLLAVLALAAPAAVGEPLGAAMVVILAAIPLLRVAWLVGRWFRRGDPRFALLGLLVISVPVIGLLLAT